MGSCNINNNRIRKKAWLKGLNSPQTIISFKWWVDTLVEDNLDRELNFIHAKCYKSVDTKCFHLMPFQDI